MRKFEVRPGEIYRNVYSKFAIKCDVEQVKYKAIPGKVKRSKT